MEMKFKNFTVDRKHLPPRALMARPTPRWTTKIPGVNLIIGAKYPSIEMTSPRNHKKDPCTVVLVNATVTGRDTIVSDMVKFIPYP